MLILSNQQLTIILIFALMCYGEKKQILKFERRGLVYSKCDLLG